MKHILVTGGHGLVGTALAATLPRHGLAVHQMDIRAPGAETRGDTRSPSDVARYIHACDGIIHLAAISRVVWAENEPDQCWRTNVDGTRAVLEAATQSARRPWVIFASSREIYGQADILPVTEDTLPRPVNVYGRSKVAGEALVEEARAKGMRACTIRLSNVYGRASDHVDRVVPAFARAAALGRPLRVEGAGHTFDFTHIDDVAHGICRLALLLDGGASPPPPIQFVSGVATTLGELADLAVRLAGSASPRVEAPPRSFDVSRFFGDHTRASDLLGWRPQIPLNDGLARLIQDIRATSADVRFPEVAR